MRSTFAILLLVIANVDPVRGQDAVWPTAIVGGRFDYEVQRGDTLATIGARFGVARATLIDDNRLARPDKLSPGQSLAINNTHIAMWEPSATLTINIAQRLLTLIEDGHVMAYPVTVGRRSWPTPVGAFTIIDKETDPVWDVPVSIQRELQQQGKPVITKMPPGPDNPLGAHWIRLSLPGLGIHGTNAPSSIYRFSSHGCIRMHPDDVAHVFERVDIGTTGVLIFQPVLIALVDGKVWLEVNPDEYRRSPNPARVVSELAARQGLGDRIDWDAVAAVVRQRRGGAVDVTKRD